MSYALGLVEFDEGGLGVNRRSTPNLLHFQCMWRGGCYITIIAIFWVSSGHSNNVAVIYIYIYDMGKGGTNSGELIQYIFDDMTILPSCMYFLLTHFTSAAGFGLFPISLLQSHWVNSPMAQNQMEWDGSFEGICNHVHNIMTSSSKTTINYQHLLGLLNHKWVG